MKGRKQHQIRAEAAAGTHLREGEGRAMLVVWPRLTVKMAEGTGPEAWVWGTLLRPLSPFAFCLCRSLAD